MPTRPTRQPSDLLSVRGQTDLGSREWFLRTGRGWHEVWRDVSTANRVMGELRVSNRLHNPF